MFSVKVKEFVDVTKCVSVRTFLIKFMKTLKGIPPILERNPLEDRLYMMRKFGGRKSILLEFGKFFASDALLINI